METFSTLLALCVGNSPVTGEFPSQRPVTHSFDVFFDLSLSKRSSKQSGCQLIEIPSCSLWWQSNVKWNSYIFVQENAFENIVCEMAAILFPSVEIRTDMEFKVTCLLCNASLLYCTKGILPHSNETPLTMWKSGVNTNADNFVPHHPMMKKCHGYLTAQADIIV